MRHTWGTVGAQSQERREKSKFGHSWSIVQAHLGHTFMNTKTVRSLFTTLRQCMAEERVLYTSVYTLSDQTLISALYSIQSIYNAQLVYITYVFPGVILEHLTIPKCTSQGRWEELQCSNQTVREETLCWCVDKETGQQTTGASPTLRSCDSCWAHVLQAAKADDKVGLVEGCIVYQ